MSEYTIKWWVAWAFGVAGAAVSGAFTVLLKRYLGMRVGMKALLRAEIYRTIRTYEPLGYLPCDERENLDDLFRAYEDTGGKGSVKGLVDKMLALPTEPPRKER